MKRLGVISPNRVHIKNYPVDNPVSVFNASALIRGDVIRLYPRVILGYFMYVSAIASLEIPLEDVETGTISVSHYPCELVIYPSMKYDIWGTEDPRAIYIDDKPVMVYVGRTINYFNPAIRRERTVPILAIDKGHDEWVKRYIFVLPKMLRSHVISDKDAVIVKTSSGAYLLFHRPHMDDENFYLVVSEIPKDVIGSEGEGIEEVEVQSPTIVLEPAKFEIKLGWATPPIEVETDTFLALVHGIDNVVECYRTLALLLKYDKDTGIRPIAISPYYVIEPKLSYEIFGDRPYTIFPCGLCKLDNNRLLIVYGAGDYVIGFGEIDLNELMSIVDKGRLE